MTTPTPVHKLLTSGNLVTIFVGPKRKKWAVHEDLICDRSDYFKKAFQGNFQEGNTKELYLEEDDPAAFGHFVDWLYGGKIACNVKHVRDEPSVEWDHVEEWCKLYVLADKLCLKELKVDALDAYKKCKEFWTACSTEIQFIYRNTTADCDIRTWVAHQVVITLLGDKFSGFDWWAEIMTVNPDFALDVGKAIRDHLVNSSKDCYNCLCNTRAKKRSGNRGN